ncbi:MAG: glycosyltransferase family protein [Rhodospirillaceae bacterium]|nr:glycosyltransferase family protein [Rhodospirillaceae bacterium]MBT8005526.1 glycosyltransferase family protein [Rhodospirillales bacterium]MBT4702637.1 glycosyltransferase family protein [Rhodospirillaceae bacterium]MBT5035407.1 glycosyltransferase family protein [Rhodospirillaceae bacterium]MBT6221948.1 glycosyltransferase family protein [Rhodospirillaceae bacterium]
MNRRLRRAEKAKNKKTSRTQGDPTVTNPAAEGDFAEAMRLHQAGQSEQAKTYYRKVLRIQPNHSVSLHHLGVIALQSGKSEDAVDYIRKAVRAQPIYPFAHNNLGNALRNVGRLEDAEKSYNTAISQKPDYAEAHYNRAIIKEDRADPEAAMAGYKQAIELKPDYTDAHVKIGVLLIAQNKYEEALACFALVLAEDPGQPAALNNQGNVFEELGRLEEALASYDLALKRNPNNADVLANKGNVLKDLRRIDEALEVYDRAVAAAPESAKALYNRGLSRLMTGRLAEGWLDYQWRWQNDTLSMSRPVDDKPVWDGRDLNGKTILLYPEQGKGDAVQFARYIALIAERGGRAVLWSSGAVLRLLSSVPGAATVCETLEEAGDYDCHASLMDLPGLFETTLETIPKTVPYISVDKDLIETWSERLGHKKDFRVGLVWAGNPEHKNDHNRSIDLELFRPLAKIKNISLYSLQVGRAEDVVGVLGEGVTELKTHLTDFAETAAAIECLDLVISVDTAVAHVAGALGKPVWVLLPHVPDWRWLLDRDDSPWYPTLRLFRQGQPGDWAGVVENVMNELRLVA